MMDERNGVSPEKEPRKWHGTLRLAFVVSLAIPLGLPLGNCGICTDVPETDTPAWEMAIVNPNRYYIGHSVAEGEEGRLYVVGQSYDGTSMDTALIIQRTEFGNPRWARNIGIAGEHVEGIAVAAAPGGGALLFGNVGDPFSTRAQLDYYLVRVDVAGNTLWDKRFGGARTDIAVDIVAVAGGYALLGTTNSSGSGGTDLEIIRIDHEGEVMWVRTYGGAANDDAADLEVTADGGFAIFGQTESFGSGEFDLYLVKTDEAGEEQWYQTYGYENYNYAGAVRQTGDGGYILAGNVGAAYLLKTDAVGDLTWERVLGEDGYYEVRGVAEVPGGGYLLTGAGITMGYYLEFCNAAFVMETDGEGQFVQTRLYGELSETNGGQIIPTRDGGHVIAGTARGGFMPEDEEDTFQSAVYLAKILAPGT